MFNEFLLLQFIVVILLFFFILLWDSFFLIINGVCFLSIIALFSWLMDSDIYINFLIIIDLGVFFILLAFLLNFISLFREVRQYSPKQTFSLVALVGFISLLIYFGNVDTIYPSFPFLVTYYDWFNIFNLYYFTDLQLLSDIYYVFAGLEFILMNFYLYSIILLLYCLQRAFSDASDRFLTSFHDNVTVRGNFMRVQDIQSQILTRATVRTWHKR